MPRQLCARCARQEITSSQTNEYVTLPTISNGVTSGQVAMHVFSVAVT